MRRIVLPRGREGSGRVGSEGYIRVRGSRVRDGDGPVVGIGMTSTQQDGNDDVRL
jgi:hypothetical protein